jgi:ParB-like chromosome segregation protein Spo0J
VRLQTWQMEVEIERLLEESPADPRRHLNQDRVRRYAEVLDQLPPVVVFELGDHTLLLADGYHRVAAAQLAGRRTVQADVRVGTKKQALEFAIDVARAEWGLSAYQARKAIRHHSDGQSNDARDDS